MTPDILRLTEQGIAALNTAENGILVKPAVFSAGYYVGSTPITVPTALLGEHIITDPIRYGEVTTKNSIRFTLYIPKLIANSGGGDSIISEVMVYLHDGTPFGHAVLSTPYRKKHGEGVRISLMMHLTEDQTVKVDVTQTEYGSIPSVLTVDSLPSPISALASAVSVLDLKENSDGSYSPAIATKYGGGGMYWGFDGYDRIFFGEIGTGFISASQFKFEGDYGLENGDTVIVQAVTNEGAGISRRCSYRSSDATLIVTGDPFEALSDSTRVAVWKNAQGGGLGAQWPPRDGVPSDYQLVRGVDSPAWMKPASTSTAGQGSCLYLPPSKLKVRHVTAVASGTTLKYDMGYELENGNYIMPSLQGVRQHKGAFEVESNWIEFAGYPVNNTGLDLRMFTKESSTGTYMHVRVADYVADGTTRAYDLPCYIATPEDALVIVSTATQSISAYTLDLDNQQLIFTEAPDAGMVIEINCFEWEQIKGYSTQIYSASIVTTDATSSMKLPVSPQTKEHVMITQFGMHMHNLDYSLVDDVIVFNTPVPKSYELEAIIFHNVAAVGTRQTSLDGVVTDGLISSKYIQLLRHNQEPVKLPVPGIDLTAGEGIAITGEHSTFTISQDTSSSSSIKEIKLTPSSKTELNVSELVIAQRVEFTSDCIIEAQAHFHAELGPGFISEAGGESLSYVLGMRHLKTEEPGYDRGARGTGKAGFSTPVVEETDNLTVYSNPSTSMGWNITADNYTKKHVELVVKVRINNADISKFGSRLRIELNVKQTVKG